MSKTRRWIGEVGDGYLNHYYLTEEGYFERRGNDGIEVLERITDTGNNVIIESKINGKMRKVTIDYGALQTLTAATKLATSILVDDETFYALNGVKE